MANAIELITQYSPKYWDIVYKQEAVTSVLDANPKMVNFTGTKTVKIGKWTNGGLKNYYRNNEGDGRITPAGSQDFAGASGFGYQKSQARLVWEEFTLKQDRAAAFEIEYFDNEESGAELVGLGVTEISRTAIVPEVDAYCLSTIAGYTSKALGNYVDDDNALTKPVEALNKALVYFANNEVPAEDQVIFASPSFVNALRQSTEFGLVKPLMQGDLNANKDVNFEITSYQGAKIITTSPYRLRTEIEMNDSSNGGYSWSATSNPINFLAVSKSAVMHIVKYEKVKVISGDANLAGRGFDGYTVFARIYHDVFVPDNKRVALYCSVDTTASNVGDKPNATLEVGVKNGKIASIVTLPGDKLYFVGTSTDESSKIGDTLTNFTIAKVGDAVTSTTTFIAVDSDKKVVAFTTITI
jgi:hypothetical protein